MNNLSEISDSDLLKELESRETKRKEAARLDRLEKVKLFTKYRDFLIHLLTHDRSSCGKSDNSSYHPNHGVAECSLCALKDLYVRDDIQINLSLTLTQIQ